MIAVYSELVFADTSLYASALAAHRRAQLTLVTALDLPWRADGLQRDGPHVRAPVDALIRASLAGAGIACTTIEGVGRARSNRRCARSTQRARRAREAGAASRDQAVPPSLTKTMMKMPMTKIERHFPADRAERRGAVGPALGRDGTCQTCEQHHADVREHGEHDEEEADHRVPVERHVNASPARAEADQAMPTIDAPGDEGDHGGDGDDRHEPAHRRVHQRHARRRLEHRRQPASGTAT